MKAEGTVGAPTCLDNTATQLVGLNLEESFIGAFSTYEKYSRVGVFFDTLFMRQTYQI
jgi:hypothetical protein